MKLSDCRNLKESIPLGGARSAYHLFRDRMTHRRRPYHLKNKKISLRSKNTCQERCLTLCLKTSGKICLWKEAQNCLEICLILIMSIFDRNFDLWPKFRFFIWFTNIFYKNFIFLQKFHFFTKISFFYNNFCRLFVKNWFSKNASKMRLTKYFVDLSDKKHGQIRFGRQTKFRWRHIGIRNEKPWELQLRKRFSYFKKKISIF